MSKFEGLRTKPLSNARFTGLRTRAYGDSTPALIGKSLATGALSNLDIPQTLGALTEQYGHLFSNPDDFTPQELEAAKTAKPDYFTSSIPISQKIKNKLKDSLNLDLQPHPVTSGQRVLSKAGEFAGSLAGAGFGGGLKSAAKLAGLGGAVGATSGTLQEGNVNPLIADIGSSLLVPAGLAGATKTLKGTNSLLSKFSPTVRNIAKQDKLDTQVGNILKKWTGEKNLPKVIERLETPSPFGINPNTAELAQNTGLSQLYRAYEGNTPKFAERTALNDSIIREQLEKLGQTGGLPEAGGEQIRANLAGNLSKAKEQRRIATEPLYDKLYSLKQQVPLSDTIKFLEKEKTFAKGTKKNILNKIETLIKNENQTNTALQKFNKEYQQFNPKIQSQIKQQLGLTDGLMPAEIKEVIEELGLMANKAKSTDQNSIANLLMRTKDAVAKDISMVPEEQLARNTYAKLSIPVSAIEKQPFLKKIVKQDVYSKDYILDPEKIPNMVLNQSPRNTRALIDQVGSNKKTMDVIKGSIIDNFLNKIELSSINSLNQQKLSYNGINKYLKKNKTNLEIIFDKDQVKVLDDVKEILKRRNMTETTGRAIGSNTKADLTILESITNDTGAKLFKTTANKSFPGKIAVGLYEIFKDRQAQELTELLKKSLIEPKIAKALLTKVSTINDTKTLKSVLSNIYSPQLVLPIINDLNSNNE